jgi:polyhydroxybutyrate depolymerase
VQQFSVVVRWLPVKTVFGAVGALVLASCGSTTKPVVFDPVSEAAPTSAAIALEETTTLPPAPEVATTCAAVDGYVSLSGARRVLLRSPAATAPRAAVVVLHGFTGSPEAIERTSGWTSFLLDKNVVIAYPEGTPVATGGFGWDTGTVQFSTSRVDDLAFIGDVVDHLVSSECVNPHQLLLTGESNGGGMTVAVACDPALSGRFVLEAPVIPAVDTAVTNRCKGAPPTPLLAIASLLDDTVPYDGHAPYYGAPNLSAQEAWFTAFAQDANACTGAITRAPVVDADRLSFPSCAAPTEMFAVHDGVHTWPGGPEGIGTRSPGAFPATRLIWCRSGLTSVPTIDCSGLPDSASG